MINSEFNFINGNSLIIPEYKIELLNKNKKIIKNIENKVNIIEKPNKKKFYFNGNKKYVRKNFKGKRPNTYKRYKNIKPNKNSLTKNY